jgi:hypothetical protein
MKQTAVEWLVDQYTQGNYSWEVYKQAKEMEEEQRIMDYNAGHADGICNHINDADNYINEQKYLKDEDID